MNKNSNNDGAVVAVVAAGLGLLGLAGLVGIAAHESNLTPEERAQREARRLQAEQARREEEQRRREAEEQRRRELAGVEVRPLRPRGEFDGVLETLLTGRPAATQTVALYSGMTLRGAPQKVLQLSGPTQVGDLLLTPMGDGVKVQWFGSFGPESRKVFCGEHEYLFNKRLTVAVL